MKLGLNKKEKQVILVNGLFNMSGTLCSLFLSVFLFTLTNSILSMQFYSICRFIMIPIFFTIAGKLTHRFKLSTILSIGLVLMIGGMLFLLLNHALFVQYPLLIYGFGLVFGSAEGMIWLSLNSLNQFVSTVESRNAFLSVLGVFNSINNILSPILSTFLISLAPSDMVGYQFVIFLSIVIDVVVFIFAARTDVQSDGRKYSVRKLFGHDEEKAWPLMRIIMIFYGIRDSFLLTLSGLLLFQALNSDGAIYSAFNIITAGISVIAYSLSGRIIHPKRIKKTFSFGAVMLIASMFVIVFFPNYIGVVLYALIFYTCFPIFFNSFQVVKMNVLSKFTRHNLTGHIIAIEYMFGIGRMIGLVFFILMNLYFPLNQTTIYSVVFYSLGIVVLILLMNRLIDQEAQSL